jgi:hypothetical protein
MHALNPLTGIGILAGTTSARAQSRGLQHQLTSYDESTQNTKLFSDESAHLSVLIT